MRHASAWRPHRCPARVLHSRSHICHLHGLNPALFWACHLAFPLLIWLQGVIPDIVTMAKGIGNGLPLGAVVTTPEIAAVLAQRLHFNTFGARSRLSCNTPSNIRRR